MRFRREGRVTTQWVVEGYFAAGRLHSIHPKSSTLEQALQHELLAALATGRPDYQLGGVRERRMQENFAAIVTLLRDQPRPIFIDKADYLVTHLSLIELLRSVHDVTAAPLFLLGVEDCRHAVRAHPQLYSRVAGWVEFRPLDFADAPLPAEELCEIQVADDLLCAIHRTSGGSARGICVGLSRVETLRRRRGKRRVAIEDLPGGSELVYGRRCPMLAATAEEAAQEM